MPIMFCIQKCYLCELTLWKHYSSPVMMNLPKISDAHSQRLLAISFGGFGLLWVDGTTTTPGLVASEVKMKLN